MQRTQSILTPNTAAGGPIPFRPVGGLRQPIVAVPTMGQQMATGVVPTTNIARPFIAQPGRTVAQPLIQAGPGTIQVARPTVPGVAEGMDPNFAMGVVPTTTFSTVGHPARSPGFMTFRPPSMATAATGQRFPILTASPGSETDENDETDIFGNSPVSDYDDYYDEYDDEPYDVRVPATIPRVIQPAPVGYVAPPTLTAPRPAVAMLPTRISAPTALIAAPNNATRVASPVAATRPVVQQFLPPTQFTAQPVVRVGTPSAVIPVRTPTVPIARVATPPINRPVVAPIPVVNRPMITTPIAAPIPIINRPMIAAPIPIINRPVVQQFQPATQQVQQGPRVTIPPITTVRPPTVPIQVIQVPKTPQVIQPPGTILVDNVPAVPIVVTRPFATTVIAPVTTTRVPSPPRIIAPVAATRPVAVVPIAATRVVTPPRVIAPAPVVPLAAQAASPPRINTTGRAVILTTNVNNNPVTFDDLPDIIPLNTQPRSPTRIIPRVATPPRTVVVTAPRSPPRTLTAPTYGRIPTTAPVIVPMPVLIPDTQPRSPPHSPIRTVAQPTTAPVIVPMPVLTPDTTQPRSPIRTVSPPRSPGYAPIVPTRVVSPARGPIIAPMPVLTPAVPTQPGSPPRSPIRAPVIAPMPVLTPVVPTQPRSPVRIASPARGPIIAPMPVLTPVVPTQPRSPVRVPSPARAIVPVTAPASPRMLPRSPQRNPIEPTPLGTPLVTAGGPDLVPRPRLVPVAQQAQVPPRPTVTVPIVTSPLRTINTQVVVPLRPNTINTGPPVPQSPPRAAPRSPVRVVASPVDTYPLTEQTLETQLPGANTNQTDNRQLFPKALSDKIVQGGLKHTAINHIDNHAGHNHEDCCICLETKVSADKKITCGHAICADCTKQLRKAECPICRARIQGGYLTQDAAQAINNATTQDTRVQQLLDVLSANCLRLYPDAPPEFCYRYREEFTTFITDNPTITENAAVRIFEAFIDFIEREQDLGKIFTPGHADREFRLIGLQMLDNPNLQFDTLYENFFQIMH